MVHTERTTRLNATPAAVWAVLTDVARWPEWAPHIPTVEVLTNGPFALGFEARLMVKGAPTSVWRVTELTEGRSFTWETKSRGVHSVASHVVEPEGEGSRLTLAVINSGFMATLFSPLIKSTAKRNLELESEGLKARAEGRS